MNDGELLLKAIAANPAELTPKLQFLDWAVGDATVIRGWIAAVVASEPRLTVNGMEYGSVDYWRRPDAGDAKHTHDREVLLNRITDFAASLAWLAGVKRRATVYRWETSYGFKHRVERAFKDAVYVANGAFIAAAIHAKICYRASPDSLNTLHGISKRSLPSPYK